MADDRKPFWTSLPGIISGIAATVTGLAVLIPLLLGAGSKHTPQSNTAAQSPSPSPSATATASPSVSDTSTAGAGATDTTSPSPTDTSSPPTGASPGAFLSPGGTAQLTVTPSSLGFGTIQQGRSTPDQSVTISDPGTAPVTIDSVELTGADAGAFTITSSTCGGGATVSPGSTCQMSVRFTPNGLRAESASLVVHYHPPASSFTTIALTGTGSLL